MYICISLCIHRRTCICTHTRLSEVRLQQIPKAVLWSYKQR